MFFRRVKNSIQQRCNFCFQKKYRDSLDKIMYFMAMIVPILTSSQVIKIWVEQNASGVSLMAWLTYFVNSIMWIVYGVVHKQGPVIVNNFICLGINFSVVVGIVIYG